MRRQGSQEVQIHVVDMEEKPSGRRIQIQPRKSIVLMSETLTKNAKVQSKELVGRCDKHSHKPQRHLRQGCVQCASNKRLMI